MTEDERCCGSGTCIINADGECWCGQKWNGVRMCMPEPAASTSSPISADVGNAGHPDKPGKD